MTNAVPTGCNGSPANKKTTVSDSMEAISANFASMSHDVFYAPAQPRRAHVPDDCTPHLPAAGGRRGGLGGTLRPTENLTSER